MKKLFRKYFSSLGVLLIILTFSAEIAVGETNFVCLETIEKEKEKDEEVKSSSEKEDFKSEQSVADGGKKQFSDLPAKQQFIFEYSSTHVEQSTSILRGSVSKIPLYIFYCSLVVYG